MKVHLGNILLIAVLTLSGCTLEDPPDCLSSQVRCGGTCINPLENSNYCGAKLGGQCNSVENDENFRGRICGSTQKCIDGDCMDPKLADCGNAHLDCRDIFPHFVPEAVVCENNGCKLRDGLKEREGCEQDYYRLNNTCIACGDVYTTTICEDDPITHIGNLTVCAHGDFQVNAATCPGNSCKNAAECGECPNQKIICENRGNTGVLRICHNGKYMESPCPSGYQCKDDLDCADCREGNTRCYNDSSGKGYLEVCTQGIWATPTPCKLQDQPISCAPNGKQCGECINGNTTCREDNETQGWLNTCNNGVWSGEAPCLDFNTNQISCANEKSCGECVKGTTYCFDDPWDDFVGVILECPNGSWADERSCEIASCNPAINDCGYCINGGYCINDKNTNLGTVQYCKNGQMSPNLEKCKTSCNPNNDACGECIDNTMACSSTQSGGKTYYHVNVCTHGKYGEDMMISNWFPNATLECGTYMGDTSFVVKGLIETNRCVTVDGVSYRFMAYLSYYPQMTTTYVFERVCPKGCNVAGTSCEWDDPE